MLSRTALRTQRAVIRAQRNNIRRNVRFQSESSKVTPDSAAGSGALTGGLAGGGAALAIVYAWYHFSGTKSAVQTAKQTKAYVDSTVDSLKVKWEENTPDTDTALKTLRDTVGSCRLAVTAISNQPVMAETDPRAYRLRQTSMQRSSPVRGSTWTGPSTT